METNRHNKHTNITVEKGPECKSNGKLKKTSERVALNVVEQSKVIREKTEYSEGRQKSRIRNKLE